MAYSNCCNCSGNCGSSYGTGYARRNNSSFYRNTYAALNTVPAYTRYRNYPFYTGNCPNSCGCYDCGCTAGVTYQNSHGCCTDPNCCETCTDNCCDHCHDHCCGHCNGCDNINCCDNCKECCHKPVYGLFNSNVPLSVTAGAAIPLVASSTSRNDFTVSGGTVTINRCGTYLATYTVNIPTGTVIDTDLIMNVNGVAQPGSLLDITDAGSYTGQTVFTANRGTVLSLVSSTAAAVTEPVGQNIVTLTLVRMD